MPQGKDIYNVLSKKMKDKQIRKSKPVIPATVNNFKVNNPTFANSRNQHPESKKRVINPNEGKPAVNGNSKTEGLIHKPAQPKFLDPGLATIKSGDLKEKKRGLREVEDENVKRETKKTSRSRNKKTNDSRKSSS